MVPYEVFPPLKLLEVSKYHGSRLYTTAFATFMNKKKYESLPADVRRCSTRRRARRPATGRAWARVDAAEAPGPKAILTARTNLRRSKEDRKEWRDATRGLDEKWVAEMEKKGQPGRALLKEAWDLAAKYGEPTTVPCPKSSTQGRPAERFPAADEIGVASILG